MEYLTCKSNTMGTVKFSSKFAIYIPDFYRRAEHVKRDNAKAPENPSNDWDSHKTLCTRRSLR